MRRRQRQTRSDSVILALCLLAALLPPAVLRAAEPSPAAGAAGETAPQALDNAESFRIGVEDVLEIMVWKEPTVSRAGLMVRPDGMISMPVVGDIMAAGRTPTNLAREIEAKLKEFFTDPHVTVLIEAINSYRVYILGEVANPGMLTLKSPTRLMEAIITAGGFNQFADQSHVRVFTVQGGGAQKMIEIDTKKIMNGANLAGNVFLMPGDMVYVP